MKKLFNSILIPVDFSAESKRAIEKAVDFARMYKCEINLLHVITPFVFSTKSVTASGMYLQDDCIENETGLGFELDKLCRSVVQSTGGMFTVKWSIAVGSWHKVIHDCILRNKIDLVLIGIEAHSNGKRKLAFDLDKIALIANVPVIAVPSDRRLVRLNSIIIPVTDFFPVRKLLYGVYLAREYNSTIMLLGITNSVKTEKVRHYMVRSSKLLRDNCNLNVQTDYVIGRNVATLVHHYAIQKYADLVILNPGSQTKMPGLFSSLRGDNIQRYSIPPVLVVNPLYDN